MSFLNVQRPQISPANSPMARRFQGMVGPGYYAQNPVNTQNPPNLVNLPRIVANPGSTPPSDFRGLLKNPELLKRFLLGIQ